MILVCSSYWWHKLMASLYLPVISATALELELNWSICSLYSCATANKWSLSAVVWLLISSNCLSTWLKFFTSIYFFYRLSLTLFKVALNCETADYNWLIVWTYPYLYLLIIISWCSISLVEFILASHWLFIRFNSFLRPKFSLLRTPFYSMYFLLSFSIPILISFEYSFLIRLSVSSLSMVKRLSLSIKTDISFYFSLNDALNVSSALLRLFVNVKMWESFWEMIE